MSKTPTPTPTGNGSKLVRLEQNRATSLDVIATTESRTQVAQLGLIYDAGLKALGYTTDGSKIAT